MNTLFLQKLILSSHQVGVNICIMVRKITLLFLLCFGLHSAVQAQVLDSVSIYLPYGTDTTCPGVQLTFTAVQSNDTFSTTSYHWYTNGSFTGVIIDTFYTTALSDGDSVWCVIYYRNSLGVIDSYRSNTLIVHRSPSFPPRVVISLTTGSNPDCAGHALTFTAYPVNGGPSPLYQWLINGVPLFGEDSITITRFFNAGDTVSVQMISNSPCAAPYNDTVYSWGVPISHDSLTALTSIIAEFNPICSGVRDSFWATVANAGIGASIAWYVDSNLIPLALGPHYVTDSLHDGDLVYCVLNAPDPCVINHATVSNVITMTVIPLLPTSAWTVMTHGANPGCLDSALTFKGHFLNFGTSPSYAWYINGYLVKVDTVLDTTFANGDILTFKVKETDNGCYTHDSISAPGIIMIRDSTPSTPLVSLIGDLLVINNGGNYTWYYSTVNSYTGTIIPGAINQTYHPTTLGYYYAIKDSANCPSLPSNIIYISLLGVKNVNAGQVQVYPNPTTGLLNLDWGNNMVNMQVDIFNILGQAVLHEVVANQSHHETDLSNLPEGNYFVVLRDEDGNRTTFKVYHTK
jgi:Secretion system C-terminal sorting domain